MWFAMSDAQKLTDDLGLRSRAPGRSSQLRCARPHYTPRMYIGQMSPAGREARRKASVLGIEGLGWDIGHAVRFLLSQEARYITGQTLVVDGGASLVGPSRSPG